MIAGVGKVVLPVEDQEQAKEFWATRLGFEATRDATYGDEHWIEVSPPNGGPILVLSRRTEDEPRPEPADQLPHSPVFLNCADLEATHRRADGTRRHVPGPSAAAALRVVGAVRGPGRHALRARSVEVRGAP